MVVDLPKADVPVQPIVAIICHPLSTEGGTLHNKVVTMTATTLRELGIATVRFNFRSVGGSAGEFDHGVGEQDDLKAVAAWVRSQRPDDRLWLAGSASARSFTEGRGRVAAGSADLDRAAGRPLGLRWHRTAGPLAGDPGRAGRDRRPAGCLPVAGLAGFPHELVRMPETSHFFHRKLIDLRGALTHGVKHWLGAAA